jgi:hypothetical protein
MVFQSINSQRDLLPHDTVTPLSAASLGARTAKDSPPHMPVTYWPDFSRETLHLVSCGARALGELLEIVFQSPASRTPLEYKEQVQRVVLSGVSRLDTEYLSRTFIPLVEMNRQLATDEQIDERRIPRCDEPAELIAATIHQVGHHLVTSHKIVVELQKDTQQLQASFRGASRTCGLNTSLDKCDLRAYPLALHVIVPSEAFSASGILRDKAAAHTVGGVYNFFDQEHLAYDPSIEQHEMMHSFNEGFLQPGALHSCGVESIRALRLLRAQYCQARQTFPIEVVRDLWKGILCDLHDEVLADAAQLSCISTPPPPIDVAMVRMCITDFFQEKISTRTRMMQREAQRSRAALTPFLRAVHAAGASTAGIAIGEALAHLRSENHYLPRPLRPHIVELAETMALRFSESINSLFSATHSAFLESKHKGYYTLGAAALLNPWQFSLLHDL